MLKSFKNKPLIKTRKCQAEPFVPICGAQISPLKKHTCTYSADASVRRRTLGNITEPATNVPTNIRRPMFGLSILMVHLEFWPRYTEVRNRDISTTVGENARAIALDAAINTKQVLIIGIAEEKRTFFFFLLPDGVCRLMVSQTNWP
jgi:hypothetical protein